MKKVFGILAVGALSACGSSNSNGNVTPPTPTTYSYGTGSPVTSGSTQETAANTATTTTQTSVQAATSGSVSNNAATLSSTPDLPILVVGSLGQGQVAMPKNPIAQSMVGSLRDAQRSGALASGCYTVSGNTITYNNCNYSASGYSYSVNGSLTATPTNISWNITATYSFTSASNSINFTGNETGNLNLTTTSTGGTVDGQATVGFSGTEVASGNTYNFAYTAQVTFKQFAWDNTCSTFGTGGKIDVTVTVNVNGSTTNVGYENVGYEFTWNGCGNLLVATGTPG
jgi:hypothetical protein